MEVSEKNTWELVIRYANTVFLIKTLVGAEIRNNISYKTKKINKLTGKHWKVTVSLSSYLFQISEQRYGGLKANHVCACVWVSVWIRIQNTIVDGITNSDSKYRLFFYIQNKNKWIKKMLLALKTFDISFTRSVW